MELRRFPPEEDAIRRFLDDLWLPYHRDLEAAVDAHTVAADVDAPATLAERVEFWIDQLEPDSARAWVAVDDGREELPDEESVAALDAPLVGFVTTEVDECPSVFERPDRLVIGDIYVDETHRGSGLADRLIERAVERAEATGCGELTLNVDVDNERALAFYEKLGFEPLRHELRADADEL